MDKKINTVESIVEWSQTLPPWQSDALRRLFVSGSLTDDDKREVLEMAKDAHGIKLEKSAPTPLPFTVEHAPGQSQSKNVTILRKIRGIKNVNALAEDQAITVAPKGVTVIYGDNGTGKSGYSRVLKRACRARHTEKILPNVLDVSGANLTPEAVFDIQEGESGREMPLQWREGDATPEQLAKIAVFDMHCARVFVDEANTVSFIPYGLDVFPKLASLFDELKAGLTDELESLQRRDEILKEMSGDHRVGKLVEGISEKTDTKAVENLVTLTEEELKAFDKLDAEVKALEVNDPAKQAASIRRLETRISDQRDKTQSICDVLDKAACKKMQDAWQLAKTKAEVAKSASADQFSNEPLPGVGSDVWREMFHHAREYSVRLVYPDKEFPVTEKGSYCPLCMQSLDEQARDRLQRFQKFIQDSTEKEAQRARDGLKRLFEPIEELRIEGVDKVLIYEIREKNEEAADLLENTTTQFVAVKDAIIEAVKTGSWGSVLEFENTISKKLKSLMDSLKEEAKAKDELVRPEEQWRIKQQHTELAARKKLREHKATVLDHIRRFKEAEKLRGIVESLNSRMVSIKGGKLTEQTLSPELQKTLENELESIGLDYIKLNLKRKGPKGHPQHQLRIANSQRTEKLTRILSEGEQRVIAIAAFMAELGLSPTKAGVILDDPVSSLDHKWAEKIAERLVREGGERQVIIFTHNISFLLALYRHAAKLQVPIKPQNLRRIKGRSGQCFDELPWDARNVKKRKDKLSNLAKEARDAYKNDPGGEGYEILHDRFYSRLRSTWERVVEDNLLNGVVKRFDSGISTQLLHSVVVDDEDYLIIYNAMSEASGGTDAHDRAAAQHDTRYTPDDMDRDLNKLNDFMEDLKKKQKDAVRRRKNKTKPPANKQPEVLA